MARQEAYLKLNYYPVPPNILASITNRFSPQKGAVILDPCAGEGDALAAWVNAVDGVGYACELDRLRAQKCATLFPYTVHDDMFKLQMAKQRVSLAWVNPPYDNGKELDFLKRVIERDWVMMDGYIAYIVYEQHLTPQLWGVLTACSSEIHILGWDDVIMGDYRHVCVIAKRGKPRTDKTAWIEALTNQAAARLWDDRTADDLPITYQLPAPKPGALEFHAYRITPDDLVGAINREGHSEALKLWLNTSGEPDHTPPLNEPRMAHLLTLVQAGALDNTPVETTEYGLVVIRSVRRYIQKIIESSDDRDDGKAKVEKQLRADLFLTTERGDSVPLDTNQKVSEFLTTYRDQLIAHLGKRYRPSANKHETRWNAQMDALRVVGQYPLFPAQKEALNVGMQYRGRGMYFVCEPGFGKTTLGIAHATLRKTAVENAIGRIERGYWRPDDVFVVICPGNLLLKWKREILGMRPFDKVLTVALKDVEGETVDILTTVAQFCRQTIENEQGARWLILDQDGVKYGEGTEHAFMRTKTRVNGTETSQIRCPITGLTPAKEPTRKSLPWTEGKERLGRKAGYREVRLAAWGERRKLYLPRKTKSHDPGNGRVVVSLPTEERAIQRAYDFDDNGQQLLSGVSIIKSRGLPTIEKNVTGEPILDPWIASRGVRVNRSPRVPLWRWLKRFMNGKIAVCYIDEIHNSAGETTDIADSTTHIAQCARFVVGLTGTLSRGYASSLYRLESIINPERLFKHYPYGEAGKAAWIRDMGALEELMDKDDDSADMEVGAFTTVSRDGTEAREIARTTPLLVAWMLDHTEFKSLIDLGAVMPNYEEIPVPIVMDEEHAQFYRRLEGMVDNPFEFPQLRAYGLLTRAVDTPFYSMTVDVIDKIYDEAGKVVGKKRGIIGKVNRIERPVLAKEQALLDTINKHLALAQGVCVYTLQSGDKRPYQARLKELIEKHCRDAKVAILTTDVDRINRETWIETQVAKGVNVLITNPALVKEGLDLLAFQAYWWHEITLQMILTVQASHRGYRPNQSQDCVTYFPYYAGTIQERQMKLLGLKLRAHRVLSGEEVSLADESDTHDLKEVFGELTVDVQATFAEINATYVTQKRAKLVVEHSDVFDVESWDWKTRNITVAALASHLNIQPESAHGIIQRLIQAGKLQPGKYGQYKQSA